MHVIFRKFVVSLLAILALGPVAAQASDPAAAGSSAVRTSEQAHSLARELRTTAERYGTDSVALQASFLVETLRAGAVGPSEVGVHGAAAPPHQDYLRIRILTGLIFDSATSTPQSRLSEIWAKVVAPAIDKMDGFDINPGGLELSLGYGLQPFAANMDGKADAAAELELRGRALRIGEATLTKLAADEIDVAGAFQRALVDAEGPFPAAPPGT